MTEQGDGSTDPVDLGKHDAGRPQDPAQATAPEDDPDFDPYRFGAPEHPVPPEYAPPGYKPPQQSEPFSPYGTGSPYGNGSSYGPGYPYGPPGAYGPPSAQPGPYGPPPQQSPYGPPPGYGRQGGYPQPGGGAFDGPPPGNGKAVASMVLGILSIVLCWTVYLDALVIIPAIVLGVMVLSNRASRSRGMAWAGVICAGIGAILAIVLTIVVVHLTSNCQDLSGSDLRQCVENQI